MRLTLLIVCAVLVFAPPAAGKGREGRLCGAASCLELPVGAMPGLFGAYLAPPAASAPYFELRILNQAGRTAGQWAYVPSARAIWHHFDTSGYAVTPTLSAYSTGATWSRLTATEDARWQRLVRGLTPLPIPRVRTATVGGRVVDDPNSYLSIFATPARVVSLSGKPQSIELHSARPTPWTGPAAALEFYASEGVVVTGGTILPLPRAVADRVRQGKSLREPPTS